MLKKIIVICFVLLIFPCVSAVVCNSDLPNGCPAEVVTAVTTFDNNSGTVNDSVYWQGHTGTDGSWLTDISTYNATYDPYSYNQSSPVIDGSLIFEKFFFIQPDSIFGSTLTNDFRLFTGNGSDSGGIISSGGNTIWMTGQGGSGGGVFDGKEGGDIKFYTGDGGSGDPTSGRGGDFIIDLGSAGASLTPDREGRLNVIGDANISNDLYLKNLILNGEFTIGDINISGITNAISIGTNNPTHNLSVIGGANFTGELIVGENITASYYIGDGSLLTGISTYNLTYNQWAYNQTELGSNAWNVSGTNIYLDSLGNNVGIGTTSPTHKLNVVGNTNITGDEWIGDDLFVTDRVGIGTATPSAKFHIKQTSQGATQGIRLTSSANPTQYSEMYWNGGTIIQDSGSGFISLEANGNLGIGDTTPSYKLDVAGDMRSTTGAYFATTSGNVGIGTVAPTHKLNVVGSQNTTGNFTLGNILFGSITSLISPEVTISNCGIGPISTATGPMIGVIFTGIDVGDVTSCTLTFNTEYDRICTVTSSNVPTWTSIQNSTTLIVNTDGDFNGGKIWYHCIGY